jgi:hypothetical protein
MDDLLRAQKRLGQTLERASIGEDRQLSTAVRERGEGFSNLFYSLMRMTRIYELNNESFKKPLAEFADALSWLLDNLGVVHLITVEDQVYVNDIRIRFKAATAHTQKLGEELARHNIGAVTFHLPIAPDDLLTFFAVVAGPPAQIEPRTSAIKVLLGHGINGVELEGVYRYLMSGEEQLDPELSEVLGRAAELVEETWNHIAAGRMLNPLSLRRMVVELLSVGLDADGLWQPVPGKTEHGPHAVRVCRLALAAGQSLGFSDKQLQDLGVAALVHDVGYTTVPEGATGTLKRHLSGGALVMLRQRGFHEAKIHRILGILYHHHDYTNLKEIPSFYARILRVAEDFDNLCQRGGLHPTAALAAMASAVGTIYDPTLFQAFVNRLGRYPPGTRLALADGRVVRSISLTRGAGSFEKPRVLAQDGQIVDLLEGGKVERVIAD